MSLDIISVKRRIKSINTTRKITKAMEMVANSKLKRCRSAYEKKSNYINEVDEMVHRIFANKQDINSKYMQEGESESSLYIIATSNLGLCGAYNSNINKYVLNNITDKDKLIIIGIKGVSFFSKLKNEIILSIEEDILDKEYHFAKQIAQKALHMFHEGKIKQVNLIYTKFINSLTFRVTDRTLLPVSVKGFKRNEKKSANAIMQFEPDVNTVIEAMVPLYVESIIYGKLVETQISEQASRRIAMEKATENADEMKDKLQLEYNKARQAAITQEISEVIAGANASS